MPVETKTAVQSEITTGEGGYRPKIFIVFYSTYLHIYKLALAIKKGVEKEGLCDVTLYQIAETLSLEVQAKIRAPPKPDVPIITPQLLREADGILFGFPTRYGTLPSQLKEFFDACGQLWATGGLSGKFSGAFVSTATQHGGQETSIFTLLTTLAHFGMMFVPLGYVTPHLNEDKVIMGGGPWGASMSAGKDGTRQPSEEELEIARIQGANFSSLVAQFHRNSKVALTTPKVLSGENEKVENDPTSETQASSLGAVAVVPSFEKGKENPEIKDSATRLADIGLPEKASSSEPGLDGVSKEPNSSSLVEKPSEVIAPLSASRALADFNLEEKHNQTSPVNLPEKTSTVSPNSEIPPIDVAPELKPKDVASNKDTESLIEMSVIDSIFNDTRNASPAEMSKTTTSNSKDKVIGETNVVESPSKDSKRDTAIVVAGVAAAAGVSALVASHPNHNSTSSKSDVTPEDTKPTVQPGIDGQEKLNQVKESYFPPQENSLHVDAGISGAAGSDTVKSPDVESRGISASNAFNKKDSENLLAETNPVPVVESETNPVPAVESETNHVPAVESETNPVPVVEAEPNPGPVVEAERPEQTKESAVAVPRKKSSLMELPLPSTATEASGFKKKNQKGSTDNVLPPTDGEEITTAKSQEGSHKKSSSFARNSATNLRRFFKSLSIRGKPSDMS